MEKLVGYSSYLIISIGITIWVAKVLHKHGALFLMDVFKDNKTLAEATNTLLVVGFYLLNTGFVTLTLTSGKTVPDWTTAMEVFSFKIGAALLFLGAAHFMNLLIFAGIRGRAQIQNAPPPVSPDQVDAMGLPVY